MKSPAALAISPDGSLYVTERVNNRIQAFKKGSDNTTEENPDKAIIVAGGGPYTGNSLWNSTQVVSNLAYRSLSFQGFDKEDQENRTDSLGHQKKRHV